jgi:TPR repeat protein
MTRRSAWSGRHCPSGTPAAGRTCPEPFRDFAGQLHEWLPWRRPAIIRADPDEAIAWLGRAAAALHHYVRAAEGGDARCMFEVAGRYRAGRGTPVDLVQSLRWYLAMLDHGNGDGIHEAHQFVDGMTDEQIVEAGRQAGRASEAVTFLTRRWS